MSQFGFLALLLLAGTSFPLAFWIARLCLAGFIRVCSTGVGARPQAGKPA